MFHSISSVIQSCPTLLQPHGMQHATLPCPSPSSAFCSNPCPLSWWCHPTISSSVIPFSSCLQSIPVWGSFLVSQFFTSGGQSIGVSASSFDSILTIKLKPLIQEQGGGSDDPLQCSCLEHSMVRGAWWAAVHEVSKSRTRLSDFTFTFHFHALEKETATHSSVLSWRIPGTAKPGGLPSMGSHRIGHDWSYLAAAAYSNRLKHIYILSQEKYLSVFTNFLKNACHF